MLQAGAGIAPVMPSSTRRARSRSLPSRPSSTWVRIASVFGLSISRPRSPTDLRSSAAGSRRATGAPNPPRTGACAMAPSGFERRELQCLKCPRRSSRQKKTTSSTPSTPTSDGSGLTERVHSCSTRACGSRAATRPMPCCAGRALELGASAPLYRRSRPRCCRSLSKKQTSHSSVSSLKQLLLAVLRYGEFHPSRLTWAASSPRNSR